MIVTTQVLAITVASYVFGAICGYIAARWQHNHETQKNNMSATMRAVVGSIVTIMWIVSMSASITITGYSTPVLVHGMMGAVVGYLFGADTAVGSMISQQNKQTNTRGNERGKEKQ